jgi:uncharacterized integral membrane protein
MANYSFAVWIVLSAGLLLLFLYAAFINLRRQHQPEVDLNDRFWQKPLILLKMHI